MALTFLISCASLVIYVVPMGFLLSIFIICGLGVVLLVTSVVDLHSRIVPNGCIVAGIAVWMAALLLEWLGGESLDLLRAHILGSLAGAFGVGLFLLVTSWAFDAFAGKQGLGGGDIKLFFVAGLFLGFAGNVLNVFLSCMFGVFFGWWWNNRARRRGSSWNHTPHVIAGEAASSKGFPFAPCIALSTLVCLTAAEILYC